MKTEGRFYLNSDCKRYLKRYLTELPRREGTIRPEVVTLLSRSFQSLLSKGYVNNLTILSMLLSLT